jgi:hypothetical protein
VDTTRNDKSVDTYGSSSRTAYIAELRSPAAPRYVLAKVLATA